MKKHYKFIIYSVLLIFNLVIWGVPSNIEKLTIKGKPVFLGRYSLEHLSFALILIPLTILIIYIVSAESTKLKYRIFAVVTLILVFLLGLFLADIILRFLRQPRYIKTAEVYHRPPLQTYKVDYSDVPATPQAFAVIRPGFPKHHCILTTDKYGFRNKNMRSEYDIVLIGDSFTEGSKVSDDEVWGRQLALKSGFTVCNLGMCGTDPLDYWLTLENFGLRLKPKLVICMIYEGNDFRGKLSEDRIRNIKIVYSSGKRQIVRRPETFGKIIRRYKKTSPLLNGARNVLKRYFILKTDYFLTKDSRNKLGELTKNGTIDWLPIAVPEGKEKKYYFFKPKRFLPFLRSLHEFRISKGWRAAKAAVEQIMKTCRKNSIRLLIVFAPSKPHIVFKCLKPENLPSRKVWKYAMVTAKDRLPPPDRFVNLLYHNIDSQEQALKDLCCENNIKFLSLTDSLVKEMKHGRQVYYTYDQHWTSVGHTVVAKVIFCVVRKMMNRAPFLRSPDAQK